MIPMMRGHGPWGGEGLALPGSGGHLRKKGRPTGAASIYVKPDRQI
jgi:hypothetical protein